MAAGGSTRARTLPHGGHCQGAFLLQAAASDPSVSHALPLCEVIDAILAPAQTSSTQESAEQHSLRQKMQEEFIVLGIFIDRLRTRPFLSWEARDHIKYDNVRQAALNLKHRLQGRSARLVSESVVG